MSEAAIFWLNVFWALMFMLAVRAIVDAIDRRR